jgi:hypothetical protein
MAPARPLGDWGTVGTLGVLGVVMLATTAGLILWGAWKLLNSDTGRHVTRAAILKKIG